MVWLWCRNEQRRSRYKSLDLRLLLY